LVWPERLELYAARELKGPGADLTKPGIAYELQWGPRESGDSCVYSNNDHCNEQCPDDDNYEAASFLASTAGLNTRAIERATACAQVAELTLRHDGSGCDNAVLESLCSCSCNSLAAVLAGPGYVGCYTAGVIRGFTCVEDQLPVGGKGTTIRTVRDFGEDPISKDECTQLCALQEGCNAVEWTMAPGSSSCMLLSGFDIDASAAAAYDPSR